MSNWLEEICDWGKFILMMIGLAIPVLIMLAVALVPTALIVTIIILLWRHFG